MTIGFVSCIFDASTDNGLGQASLLVQGCFYPDSSRYLAKTSCRRLLIRLISEAMTRKRAPNEIAFCASSGDPTASATPLPWFLQAAATLTVASSTTGWLIWPG